MTSSKIDQPLGLTVHGQPAVHELGQAEPLQTRSGRWKMLVVLLVCAAPVLASYFTYYVLRPDGRRNFGQLIEPQQAMPAGLEGRSLQGQPLPLADLQGQWLLISVGGSDCPAQCQNNLYLQRQLRESLGRDKDRLERVWLISDDQRPADSLQPALQGAEVLQIAPAQLQTWLQPEAGHELGEHLYLVDPLGHWMLRWPAGLDSEGAAQAKRDLVRLMRASASWDKPGR